MAFEKFSGLISSIGDSISRTVKATPSTKSNLVRVSSSAPSIQRQDFSTKFKSSYETFKQNQTNNKNNKKSKKIGRPYFDTRSILEGIFLY